MELKKAILARHSVRGFRDTPVPRKVIEEILETATRSTSAQNSQPWEFLVLTGEALQKIKDANTKMAISGAQTVPDTSEQVLEGVYNERARENGRKLYSLLGINSGEGEKRNEWGLKGLRYFDAPCAILLYTDETVYSDIALFDLGAVSQLLCVTALEYGLGTCIQRSGVAFPGMIRKYTGLPDTKRFVVSIALGYPDDSPANKLHSTRAPVKDVSTFLGFD